jgi:FkbM family methyltransferase
VQDGPVVSVDHAYYGPLRLLAADKGISRHLLDGVTVWEPDIVALFAREFQAGRNVVDAGANLGLHSIALAKLATRGETVYALEPHPEILPLTRYNCGRFPNIRCIDRAASDEARVFSMPSVRGWENAGGAGLEEESPGGVYRVESVTIDSLGLENVGLMKIDVEGHELACLRGAVETIRRDRPTLVVEICGGNDVRTAPPEIAAEIRSRVAHIADLGYDVEQFSVHDYLCRPRA